MTEPTVVVYGVWFPATVAYASPSTGLPTQPDCEITYTLGAKLEESVDDETEAVAEIVRIYLEKGLSQKAIDLLRMILERAEASRKRRPR